MAGLLRRASVLASPAIMIFPAMMAAQAPPLSTPQFDVASIKPSQAPQGRGLLGLREDINTTPGNLTMRNVTAATCVRWAYHLNPYQISGPDSI